MMRTKIFSVHIHDCEVQTFRSGGKGGQNQNKVESGVRVIHPPSGARGEARDSRNQLENKRNAFRRMAESKLFNAWVKTKAAELQTGKTLDQRVEEEMQPEHLKIEVRNSEGKWEVLG
jgi:protein subunit release factor B